MKLGRLAVQEFRHHAAGSALAVITVAVATALVVGTLTWFGAYDLATERLLEQKQTAVDSASAQLQEEYRKITLGLGFNMLILPKNQQLSDLYADDFASEYMPEEYADRLANSSIVSVQHLLPSLIHKLVWPEKRRTIIVTGVKGEVPLAHRNPKKPLQDAVAPGTVVAGNELCQSLGLAPGQSIRLMGREFKVDKCYPARGNRDDITLWINLAEAQEMLDKKGLINAILALECRCVADGTLPNIAKIRSDLQAILPETQVIEFMSKVLTRAEARFRAYEEARDSYQSEQAHRRTLRAQRENTAAGVVPAAIAACFVLVIVLGLDNARKRRVELAMLRAQGFRGGQVQYLFMVRSALLGLLGACLGWSTGFGGAVLLAGQSGVSIAFDRLFDPVVLAVSVAATPLVTVVAGWLPALAALRQDPADILREE